MKEQNLIYHSLWKSIMSINSAAEWKLYRKDMLACQTCKECSYLSVDYWICNGDEYDVI